MIYLNKNGGMFYKLKITQGTISFTSWLREKPKAQHCALVLRMRSHDQPKTKTKSTQNLFC